MAGLTKEQRALKEAEEKKKLEDSIRAELEKEYKQKLAEAQATSVVGNSKVNRRKKIDVPAHTIVPVKSGVHGILTYSSKKTFGYKVDWDDYDSVEFVEYGELLSMRNTQRSFFENNWIFLEDTDEFTAQELYQSLAVEKYYNNVIVGEDLEALFTMTPENIELTVSKLSSGIKRNIAAIAKGKMEAGEFDSLNRIKALEKSLGLELAPSY